MQHNLESQNLLLRFLSMAVAVASFDPPAYGLAFIPPRNLTEVTRILLEGRPENLRAQVSLLRKLCNAFVLELENTISLENQF